MDRLVDFLLMVLASTIGLLIASFTYVWLDEKRHKIRCRKKSK